MKNNPQMIKFEVRNINPYLLIVKSFFGYFFINNYGIQVQNPDTKEIIPSKENDTWSELMFNKENRSPFLREKISRIIKRLTLNHEALLKSVPA